MQMRPISSRVNKPENDDPSIVEPIDDNVRVSLTAHSPLGRPPFCELLADAATPADERRLFVFAYAFELRAQ